MMSYASSTLYILSGERLAFTNLEKLRTVSTVIRSNANEGSDRNRLPIKISKNVHALSVREALWDSLWISGTPSMTAAQRVSIASVE